MNFKKGSILFFIIILRCPIILSQNSISETNNYYLNYRSLRRGECTLDYFQRKNKNLIPPDHFLEMFKLFKESGERVKSLKYLSLAGENGFGINEEELDKRELKAYNKGLNRFNRHKNKNLIRYVDSLYKIDQAIRTTDLNEFTPQRDSINFTLLLNQISPEIEFNSVGANAVHQIILIALHNTTSVESISKNAYDFLLDMYKKNIISNEELSTIFIRHHFVLNGMENINITCEEIHNGAKDNKQLYFKYWDLISLCED